LTLEKAMLPSFEKEMRKKYMGHLGQKASTMLGNISRIKELIWCLLNRDCV
jgi:hypothetical protein